MKLRVWVAQWLGMVAWWVVPQSGEGIFFQAVASAAGGEEALNGCQSRGVLIVIVVGENTE